MAGRQIHSSSSGILQGTVVMWTLAWLIPLVATANTVNGGFLDFFKSKVCYDLIGCFNNSAPFTNSWHQFPDSPEENGVTLTLYTRNGPIEGEALDYKQARSIKGTHFNLDADTKFLIHGYMDDGTEHWVQNFIKTLLNKGDFNVIKVAWGHGAHDVYPKSVSNTRVVGAVTAYFLRALRDQFRVDMSRVHLLGHSLGAHIAGYIGKGVNGIGRISGMDPAGPLFENADPAVRIASTDADFVDCIHTDGLPFEDLGFGTLSAWCDADYYPNGGQRQVGCPKAVSGAVSDAFDLKVKGAASAVTCSHSRSHELYADSLHNCMYKSTRCASYDSFNTGVCTCVMSGCAPMGYAAIEGRQKGKFYLNTTGTAPFC